MSDPVPDILIARDPVPPKIRDEAVRQKVRALTHRLLGRGEPLP